ncbi:Kvs-4 [Aphelenchoides besseyi]|nr:Kvs-4 [Aphelenchoides besseyi]
MDVLIGKDSSLFEATAYHSDDMNTSIEKANDEKLSRRKHVDELLENLTLIGNDESISLELEKRVQASCYFPAFQSVLKEHKNTIILPEEKNEISKLQAQSRILDRSACECVTTMIKTDKDNTDPVTVTVCRAVTRSYQQISQHLSYLHTVTQKLRLSLKVSFSNLWSNRSALEQLLQRQARIRPISSTDLNNAESTLLIRELNYGNQIKTDVCNYSMIATSLFLRRHRRRNFPKKATKVLNEYFEAHMDDPYPSDETKEQLAKACNVTVAQVSNWFGNKRIRFKKSLDKPNTSKSRRNQTRQKQ